MVEDPFQNLWDEDTVVGYIRPRKLGSSTVLDRHNTESYLARLEAPRTWHQTYSLRIPDTW